MSFKEQSALAKSKTQAYRKNYEWKSRNGRTGYSVGTSYSDWILRQGFDEAYKAKDGYVIKKNPITKENEMFVRGTAKGREWVQNAVESIPRKAYGLIPGSRTAGALSFKKRREYASKLDDVAKKNNVKKVYGHSRGAAIISDMKSPVKKVGVDGAMILAERGRRGFLNYRQRQPFDWMIGRGESKTKLKKGSWNPRNRKFHKVYYN